MFKEITEVMRMQMAHDIANGASALDWAQSVLSVEHVELQEAARLHVEKLHDIAMTLCGSRVLEVYGPEEVMEPFQQPVEHRPAYHDAEALQQEAT